MQSTIGRELAALAGKQDWSMQVHDHDPQAKVGGVYYALVMGDGYVLDEFGQSCPIYVWVSTVDPEYSAPLHVSKACDDAYELAVEIRQAELEAGWDPNP